MKQPLAPLLVALALLAGACASTGRAPRAASTTAAPPADTALTAATPLPLDPNVRVDTLDNGVVYYIRRNTEPENRAELRLAVDAGSVLERDEERGLAHLLEHMLFNGTERFPEQELVDFLERTGMQFGADVNAYTSFDETVYTLTIPTDSARIVEQAFDVLEDWAHRATLSDEEIDRERPVIVEEWRLRTQNAQGRLNEKILPALLHGSRYEHRLPIGTPEIIRNVSPQTVRDFYRRWYRPDLMAVVAVGDFDPDRIERLIRDRFGRIPPADRPAPRPAFEVPPHRETIFTVATDPEQPTTSIEIAFKQEARVQETVADYREGLVSGLFNGMLNKRFAEIARRPDAPYLGAYAYRGGFVRPSLFYGLQAEVQEDSVLAGLEALVTEAARVRAHGFTGTELARQKQEFLRSYRRAYEERENSSSASYAEEYVGHFLEEEPTPGIAYELRLAERLLPQITLEEVNRRAAELLEGEGRAVIVTMPEKEGLTPPAAAQLAAVLDRVAGKEIPPYVDDVSDAPLVGDVPAPAAVVSEREIPEVGVTELTLANGVRVVMKPTDFKEDEVRFTAGSPGGSSLVSDEDYLEASIAAALVAQSGVGAFDRTALQKRLSGKVVNVSPYVGELEEGLSGSASPQDLETLFQLVHLYFTQPRADSAALAVIRNQQRAYLTNRSATPAGAFQDTLIATLYGDHPRRRVPTLREIEAIDLDRAAAVYRDRFADAGDFTFVFAGSFDPDSLRRLARTYLGTLPATPREETWRDVEPEPPAGRIEKIVRKGTAPQSQVAILFHGPFAFDQEHRHRLQSLADVLQLRLREELREDRGGVYGVGVQQSTDAFPDPAYQLAVVFGCAPERVDELVAAVFRNVEALREEGPAAEDVEKVREQQRRERETALRTNAYWVSVLDFYYTHDEPVPSLLRYPEVIESLTPAEVRDAARRYLDPARLVQVVLYPES